MAYDSFGSSVKRGFLAMPVAIRAIIGINTAVFFVQILSSILGISLIQWLAFIPDLVTAVTQPWRLVTYMFTCLLYTSPSPRDGLLSRMPSSA